MKIAVIGTGYVGLVSGVCLAEFGFDVTCVDTNPQIIERLSRGEVTIFETGLESLLQSNLLAGRLSFTGDLSCAAATADVIFIAVGTPSDDTGGEADLGALMAAADAIAPVMKSGAVVVVKSTVTVGTCAIVRERIRAARPDADFSIVSNPEFLREGSAIADFMHPDRVVVGYDDDRAKAVMQAVYQSLSSKDVPILFTKLENAELIKYAANAFLAMKVTFINQVADLCEKIDGNVQDVAKAIGLDARIGGKFLNAGPGIGGSCFPKDMRAFAALGRRHGTPQRLIESVVDVNEARKLEMARRIIAHMQETGGKVVAVLGVAYKANTDDMREAPALDIIPPLLAAGLTVRAHDPAAMPSAKLVMPDIDWCPSSDEAIQGADLVVILTDWDAYRHLDPAQLAKQMRGTVIFDTRNLYRGDEFKSAGLTYHSVGRMPVQA